MDINLVARIRQKNINVRCVAVLDAGRAMLHAKGNNARSKRFFSGFDNCVLQENARKGDEYHPSGKNMFTDSSPRLKKWVRTRFQAYTVSHSRAA